MSKRQKMIRIIRDHLRELVIAGVIVLLIVGIYGTVCLLTDGSIETRLSDTAFDYVETLLTGHVLPERYQGRVNLIPASLIANRKQEIQSYLDRQLLPGSSLIARDYGSLCYLIDLQLSGSLVIESCSCEMLSVDSVELNDQSAVVRLRVLVREAERYTGSGTVKSSQVYEYDILFTEMDGRWRINGASRIMRLPTDLA